MNTSKIIKGVVSNGRYTVTAPIVKEDYGLYLQIEGVELPPTYEVDFSNSENSGSSVTMIGNSDGVLIPHQFIETGKDVFAFLYHVGEDFGRTVYKFHIPNKVRPDRTDDTPTPEQQSVIDQAISALNEAVAQTAQDVESADQSAQSAQGYAEQAEDAKDNAQTYANNASASATSASESATASANSATASANSASQSAQIKADVEGMVSNAQGYANSASQSANASANSASYSQGYAQSASASAQSASGYASSAQGSANTASAKAQDASGYAQTASEKASEASQSATTASNKATEASGYATSAQTAQGKAEDAQTAAETAQGLAESARDSAIQAKNDAESAVASIGDALADKADIITDTASGSIASFSDGADDLPLKNLVVDINPIQDLSNGDPSPENICPISGWTQVGVEQMGKNLWSFNSSYSPTGYQVILNMVPFDLKAGTYTFSAVPNLEGDSIVLFGYHADGTRTEIARLLASTTRRSVAGTISKDVVSLYFVSNRAGTISDIQLELGSTATPYEPYTGRSITIDLGQTVYGGHLDVLTGELVIENKRFISDGSDDWGVYSSYSGYYVGLPDMRKGARQDGISNMLTNSKSSAQGQENAFWLGINNNNVYLIGVYDSMGATLNEFNAYLAEHNLEIMYPLATPIEIQLTPNQVNSLYGVNNIWADSGDTEVEYRADTKLYIERLTVPDSADMIADANITSGKYFMVGNSLYKATANIANGSAIIVGTNCIRKSLPEALNEINA